MIAAMKSHWLPAVAVAATSLVVAAPSFAQPHTTNAPQMQFVKVTITDTTIVMKPPTAQRGSTVLFVVHNRGAKPHTLLLGDVERGPGKKVGFARTLGPDEQQTVVMFLDYRGTLDYSSSHPADLNKRKMKGAFKIS